MDFTCNVCSAEVRDCPDERIDRDIPSCPRCYSMVRGREIVHLLSVALFGKTMAIADFPKDKSIVGIGLSDWLGYAEPLAGKLGYTNTFFHQEPVLNISRPIPDERLGSCDFLLATDVFEHVVAPVENAFRGAFDLLKPGGLLILTVPYIVGGPTVEHYPDLCDYRIVQFGDDYVVLNRTRDGRYVVHEGPAFHAGPGTTLEMRIFSRDDLLGHIAAAGFEQTRIIHEDVPRWGIVNRHPWSLPILTRKP